MKKIKISSEAVEKINDYLAKESSRLVKDFEAVVAKYGMVDAINAEAKEAAKLENQLKKLEEMNSPYLKDLGWLMEAKEKKEFVSKKDFLNNNDIGGELNSDFAVTLEISALQFFPWLITEANRAIEKKELMPGRFIRVRNMKEQESDGGDLIATSAAMNILGASYVETLDTKGTDGSNVHLGGPDTITGYFGGVGQPNDYALKWLDEYLYYYTKYGVRQVLNVNQGTILLGYFLRNIGIENEFKISVFVGNDNPYAVLSTLILAKLFESSDGKTPLIGFNLSNAVDNQTLELSAEPRAEFGFEDVVRFEHHITEAYRHIVRQPYNRREELVEIANKVKNISAKHEGADPEREKEMEHPSDILDYFISKEDIEKDDLMEKLEKNYLAKHEALNLTAKALLKKGIDVIEAGVHDYV